ncbi:MAG: hypothetical protein DIU61_008800 [Bacteroidota bacterium]
MAVEGPKNIKELFNAGYAKLPALSDLICFANPATGIVGVNTIETVLALIQSSTSSAPIQVFDDITDLLANTGISEGSFAFVTDASDHILNGWGLYQYLSGSRSSISSYQLIAYNVDITKQFTLSWYRNQIDNSTGDYPDETVVDRDIFAHFPTNFPNNGYFVTALVKLKALAIQSPSEGNGYYAAEKFYTFHRTYMPQVTLKGSNAPYVDPDDDGAKAELSVSDDDTKVRLTLTTPAGDTYAWNVIAEITYSSFFYEV